MHGVQPSPQVLPFREAREVVERYAAQVPAPDSEALPSLECLGRVLAEAVTADRDLPPFHRSTRDGYALRSADVTSVPKTLRVVGELRAGDPAAARMPGLGEAVEIMTGAAAPEGTDAVVMVEYTTRDSDAVSVLRTVEAGENVVVRGSEARAGDVLAAAGTRVTHATVALAASTGRDTLKVYRRPTVAIISTGDEVVAVSEHPKEHQIRNSNSYSLAAQVLRAGAVPIILPIAPDDPERMRPLVARGLTADVLLLSGGVSMGKYDFVEQVLETFEARVYFNGALIQPGKPVVFLDAAPAAPRMRATDQRVPVFGLPGNPVSTMVTFDLFVRPVLDALTGAKPRPLRFSRLPLAKEIRTKTGLTRFLPAEITGAFEDTRVQLLTWRGSGDVVSVARSQCYIVVPPDCEHMAAGEMVPVFVPGCEL
ncbi:MAG TPA: gephyrin-like molybdotransferase Glp [Clostridia bacterium]|nr:gephyrin-like molybdotransferase Glp [Clostridia bacterium]